MEKIKKLTGVKIRNGKYVIDKQYKGTPIYQTLKPVSEMTLEDAYRVLYKLIDEVDEGTYEQKKLSRSLTVDDALNYLWEKRLKHKSYSNDLTHILSRVSEKLGPKLITKLVKSDFEEYKRLRLSEPKRNRCKGTVGPRSVQKELQHLSMAINLLVDDGKLLRNPIKKWIKVNLPSPKKTVLDGGIENGEQWNQLYQCMASSIKPIILTLYETGMRPKEVFNMRWHWIEKVAQDRWIINIPDEDILDSKTVFEEKTGTHHRVPISPKLLQLFKEIGIRKSNDLVFPAPRKDGPRSDIESAFTNALRRSDLKGLGIAPYSLRRTRATIWDEIDPIACMSATGHSPKNVHYKHYVSISDERLFKLVGLSLRNSEDDEGTICRPNLA